MTTKSADPVTNGIVEEKNTISSNVESRVLNAKINPWAGDIAAYERKPWNDTARGRLAIRMVSRGILGAGFYAIGQIKGGGDMKGYDSSHSWSEIWNGTHLEGEMKGQTKWLQLLAKGFDSTIGNAIKGTVKFITNDEVKAAESVMFRPTRLYGFKNPGLTHSNNFSLSDSKKSIWGRSLGAEIVAVTYDFACMSVGDGLAREYLIPMLDPAIEKKWLKKEITHDASGKEVKKTHIDFAEAGKSFGKAAWRLFTYNAGEDWFAGPIYVYYMKWQRNLIDKHSPGFGYDSDRSLNGGSFKVNSEGKVTGNFNAEGMLDLMGRFSFYNFLTLMFREGYNKTGNAITKYWDTGKLPETKLPESIPDAIHGAFEGAYGTARYMVKSFIKAYTYMIPASFVFAAIRTSQSKDIGLAIHQEKNGQGKMFSDGPLHILSEKFGKTRFDYIHANGSTGGTGSRSSITEPDANNQPQNVVLGMHNNRSTNTSQVPNPFSFTRNDNGGVEKFGYYKQDTKLMDYPTNFIGKASHQYGNVFKAVGTKAVRSYYGNPSADTLAQNAELKTQFNKSNNYVKNAARRFSKASLSYTPYFFMKTDVLSRAWDNERVDLGLNRTIDGATNFKWGEFTAGLGEWWSELKNEPFKDPAREALAKKEIKNDEVTGDGIPISQNYLQGIPSGYNYVPSVRSNPIAYEQRGSFVDSAQPAQSIKTIIADQKSKQAGSWSSKQEARKEQNAPTTTQIN